MGKNTAFLGYRRTGKTLLLKQFISNVEKEVKPVYIDFNRISLSPENFSLEFISKLEHLDSSNELKNIKQTIENELQKIKPDQRLIVKTSFDFLEELSKKHRIILCLDNFENIFDLNNFSQIDDILSFMDFNNKNITFIVTSSAIYLIKKLLKNFEIIELKNLDKKQTETLANKYNIKNKEIYDYIYGHPYLIKCLCERLEKTKDIKKAFSIELSEENINRHCEDVYSYSLNRARGKSLLKVILKVLADSHEASLTEISKKIYRSAPVTKALLERLIEVDLISKHNKKFSINDPILEKWLK